MVKFNFLCDPWDAEPLAASSVYTHHIMFLLTICWRRANLNGYECVSGCIYVWVCQWRVNWTKSRGGGMCYLLCRLACTPHCLCWCVREWESTIVCLPEVIHLLSESSSHVLAYAHAHTNARIVRKQVHAYSMLTPTQHIRTVHRLFTTLAPCF